MELSVVAFLGLGTMGEGMVANLVAAGLQVRAYNRSGARAEALAARLGPALSAHARPAEAVDGAEVVMLCLADDAAVQQVVFGAGGVGETLGAGAVLVDHGTTGLELTARLEVFARERRAAFLDAPITGSKLGAERGALTFMVGGPDGAVARVRPLFEAMGEQVVHVSPSVGAGQRAKFCLNMSQAVVLQGVLEGYALARKAGVPLEKMAEIFERSAGRTGVGSFKTPYLQAGDFRPHFKLGLMRKDLRLALALADELGLVLPLATDLRQVYDRAVAHGLADEDFLATAKLIEREGGVCLTGSEPGGGPGPQDGDEGR